MLSGSVRIGVRVVPIWGCNERDVHQLRRPRSTLVTVIVRSSYAQVIPVIVVCGIPGIAVFAAGASNRTVTL